MLLQGADAREAARGLPSAACLWVAEGSRAAARGAAAGTLVRPELGMRGLALLLRGGTEDGREGR